MDKKKYELEDDELDEVMGGMAKTPACRYCEMFLARMDALDQEKKCDNCFFYHGNDNCSLPQ